ncbi:hypothetical protein [Flammeovirga kamogawensis]|uniref:Transporter n=1 Tax=Flammeovirga kamogawensis TaxID=373891 RepID=A0ABX8H1I4_9BACT|nr:hypothetical protein [Flammeovirga kamogawensis]MBB6463743.1 hypothetical protein [Flammeovirga kamogawensis]QWG09745.1 hypothetical protein KM029_24410 [Flammeovirga kamogawensis]TRX65258.1 hypothetical protein EO216_22300 [Flammeovirga kamogawensis]
MIRILLFLLFLSFSNQLIAQNSELDSLSRKATDPTAIMWQLQLEDFWEPLTSTDDFSKNQFRVRIVLPLSGKNKGSWDHLIRVTFKGLNTTQNTFGLGDTEVFDMIIPKRYSWGAWSLGPLAYLPTATNSNFGSGKFSLGLAAGLSFNNPSMGRWQVDFLLEYLHSVAGDMNKSDANQVQLQPSITYHLNQGFYLETEPVFAYSFEHSSVTLPINLRFGKVWIINGQKYNTYIEPETTMYSQESTYTIAGFRFGLRFLFKE